MVTAPWPSAVTVTESNPPLTTNWHVPESCTWTYDPHHTDTDAVAWLDLKPRPLDPDATTLSCYPDGMFDGDVWGVFSPASCPRGWTTVDTSSDTDRPAEEALTTATCCSSNYVYQSGYCGRKIPYVIAVPITYLTIDSITTYSILTESTTILENATIAVHTILAEWQAADATSIAGLGETPNDQGDGSGIDLDSDDGLGGGLSTDAKAGIGVGVALALFLIGAIVFLIFRRHRESSKQGAHEMEVVYRGSSERNSGAGGGRMRGSRDGSTRHHRERSSIDPPLSYDAGPDSSSLEAGGGRGVGVVEYRNVSPTSDRTIHRDAEIIVLREQKKAIQRRIEALQTSDQLAAR
jgi:hypothetical protein